MTEESICQVCAVPLRDTRCIYTPPPATRPWVCWQCCDCAVHREAAYDHDNIDGTVIWPPPAHEGTTHDV